MSYVIAASLSSKDRPELPPVTVDFPIPPENYGRVIGELEALGIGDIKKQDCRIESLSRGYDSLSALVGKSANVDELDYLAKRLDSFWEPEANQFEGAAAALGIDRIEGFINLTFSCQEVTVIKDFSDLAAIGKEHTMNIHGGSMKTSEYEKTGFAAVARDLLANGKPKITPCGLVYLNGMEMDALYQGREFPPYVYEQSVLEVEVRNSPEDKSATLLCLPMPELQMERMLERGGIDPANACINADALCVSDELFRSIDLNAETLADLNKMSAVIKALDDGQRETLCAASALAEPVNAKQLANLAGSVGLFDFYPNIHDADDYGRYMIRESGHYEYDENLEEFYDYEGLGNERIANEQGEFLDAGYVCYRGFISIPEVLAGGKCERMEEGDSQDWHMKIT
jgi:hypothetical protein